MLLAELGADVLRVDRPGGGARIVVPPEDDVLQPQPAVRRGRPEVGRGARRRSCGWSSGADVLDRGAAARRHRAAGRSAPTSCLARNPRLVYARMTGWGQDGPLAARAGHDINYLGLTGALHAIGTADKPVPPLNIGADFGGGSMFLVVGHPGRAARARHQRRGARSSTRRWSTAPAR